MITSLAYRRSLDHVAAVRAARDTLNDLYANAPHERERIGEVANELRDGLKLAEIQSNLAIADELRGIGGVLADILHEMAERR